MAVNAPNRLIRNFFEPKVVIGTAFHKNGSGNMQEATRHKGKKQEKHLWRKIEHLVAHEKANR